MNKRFYFLTSSLISFLILFLPVSGFMQLDIMVQNEDSLSSEERLHEKTLKGVVLIHFETEWAGVCRVMRPIIKELREEYKGKVNIIDVNVDIYEKIPEKYGIRSVPTIVILKEGELVDKQVGATGKKALMDMLNKQLDKNQQVIFKETKESAQLAKVLKVAQNSEPEIVKYFSPRLDLHCNQSIQYGCKYVIAVTNYAESSGYIKAGFEIPKKFKTNKQKEYVVKVHIKSVKNKPIDYFIHEIQQIILLGFLPEQMINGTV